MIPETFWEWAGSIIVSVLALIGIKGVFKLDLNAWRQESRRRLKEKLQMNCPHAVLNKEENNRLSFMSTFFSPPGTLKFQCEMCGMITSGGLIKTTLEIYAENPDLYFKRLKDFGQIQKKLLK